MDCKKEHTKSFTTSIQISKSDNVTPSVGFILILLDFQCRFYIT